MTSTPATPKTMAPPKPYGPVPSQRQLAWHELEFYGFLHFTVNTFTDKEWGYGDESPSVFNPTDFDADAIVSVAAEGGMRGLILTAKHHDGFCLWPSPHTKHSVAASPWKNGKGNVVRAISDACQKQGLKFGVYLSPWDRNHAQYASPEYITYYRKQLRELLTEYGPLFEVWFDGANGGDGYYGGASEQRKIDAQTYYDWQTTWNMVRELQPNACMFSDAGPDIRWVGNERGVAGDPCWHTISSEGFVPGSADNATLNSGQRYGTTWLPAECDVSIRPGWFYHASQDDQVRSPQNLLDLYFQSVGRGAALHLNLPPDRRGRIHETDAQSLRRFRQMLDRMFATNLATSANITASNTRGANEDFATEHLVDADNETYWATDDAIKTAEVFLDFGQPITFNILSLREYLPLGQRIEQFSVDILVGASWQPYARGTAIGHRRLVRGEPRQTQQIRISIKCTSACPALSEVGVYYSTDLP